MGVALEALSASPLHRLMRILYVHPPADTTGFGGIQTYARELVEGIRGRGYELAEVVLAPETLRRDLHWRDWLPLPPYIDPFFFKRSYYRDYRFHRAVERIVRSRIREFRPQVVHALHVYQLGGLRAATMPSVVTCHGLEIDDSPLVAHSLAEATVTHCNSRFTEGLAHAVGGFLLPTRVLSWGVPTRELPPTAEADFDLITVSRLVRRKNVESVLRALQGMPGVRYAVVGDGPERGALEEEARRLGLRDVHFFGEVEEARKWELMARSRAFVMAPRNDLPRDVEGLGLVYYEAHAVGLPVLAARSGGVPDAVGEGGILLDDPRDVTALRAAIHRILDPAEHARLAEAVRRRRSEHSWERYLDHWEALYGELVERRA